MTTKATTLSDATSKSLQASLDALDALGEAILAADDRSVAVDSDDGVETLLGYVETVREHFNLFTRPVAGRVESPRVVELLTEQIVPALAEVVGEFTTLWGSLLTAVESGEQGIPLVDDFLKACVEHEQSAAARLQLGLVRALKIIAMNNVSEQSDML